MIGDLNCDGQGWAGKKGRRRFHERKCHVAALSVQRVFRGHRCRKERLHLREVRFFHRFFPFFPRFFVIFSPFFGQFTDYEGTFSRSSSSTTVAIKDAAAASVLMSKGWFTAHNGEVGPGDELTFVLETYERYSGPSALAEVQVNFAIF